jgi:hypothetical protein
MKMQQNKDINEMDDFSKLVRQKMKNHRIAVDADCWDNIEQQLKPKKSMRMALWTAASVVAVALLVLLFVPFKSSGSFDEEVTDLIYTKPLPDISRQKEKTGSADNGKSEKQNITIKKSAGSVRLISQQVSKSVSGNNGSSGTTQPVENSLLTPDTVQLANSGNPIAIADPDSGSGLPVADSVPSQEYKKINKSNKPAGILIEKTKKHDKWLLAASFSSGGGISLGGRDMDNSYYQPPNSLSPAMNDGGTVPVFTDNGDEFLEYDQLTDVNHSLPLSFGIAVRKDMSDRFALETGLVYTYLSSEFSKSGYFTYRAKQELHYLGIPVNVIVYLWNNPQWNVYASIGGMGEKGLRLNYMQNVLQKNKDNASSVSVNENIRGLQWSVNVSVGVTYKFYQNWGIYFEPRYSYYFDNSQPFSIRTENPKVFGISAGFRYEF